MLYAIIAINAWLWSSIYHARKLPFPILADLCAAFTLLACSLLIFAVKLCKDKGWTRLIPLLGLCFVAAVVHHVYNMATSNYHFSTHMTICISLGGVHVACWLLWTVFSRSQHRLLCFVAQVWFVAASMLELFDFPPILRYFDAHSLWHAATIPLGFLWYEFLRREMSSKVDKVV